MTLGVPLGSPKLGLGRPIWNALFKPWRACGTFALRANAPAGLRKIGDWDFTGPRNDPSTLCRMLHGDELGLAADSLAKLGELLGLAGAKSEEAIGHVGIVDKDDCFVFAVAHKLLVRWGYG